MLLLPNDNGQFFPQYKLIEDLAIEKSLTSSFVYRQEGVDYGKIVLENLMPTGSLYQYVDGALQTMFAEVTKELDWHRATHSQLLPQLSAAPFSSLLPAATQQDIPACNVSSVEPVHGLSLTHLAPGLAAFFGGLAEAKKLTCPSC